MSISEIYLVDGFNSTSKDNLGLIINDPLIWNKEIEETHIYYLKNKFDYYIEYIKNKKYESMFKNKEFTSFTIEFKSDYKLPLNALSYIKKLEKELESDNIKIVIKITSVSGSC
ncbi:DUF6572 domain-containing protein [Miniphocaeibacter massiliensis]|uniref:DUF6572 domain-containing protein n=1 Tax=Miniphocaeibacter massiliensis TaxID=2041841 RepID=UPI000C1C6C76|nr:DUF6572 domain-containing protein [Miniphocaeibacter massiliensis]